MTPTRDEWLAAYREKRTASRTPEPFGGQVVSGGSVFVVQKHAARGPQWGLRLAACMAAPGAKAVVVFALDGEPDLPGALERLSQRFG
jgi:hypothetical protein